MKDEYSMSHYCSDNSFVEYRIESWIQMVYQTLPNGTKRKARYKDGKWENTF